MRGEGINEAIFIQETRSNAFDDFESSSHRQQWNKVTQTEQRAPVIFLSRWEKCRGEEKTLDNSLLDGTDQGLVKKLARPRKRGMLARKEIKTHTHTEADGLNSGIIKRKGEMNFRGIFVSRRRSS